MFKSWYWLLGTLATAFSLIGLVQSLFRVGLRGVFADFAAWSHSWAEWMYSWVVGWPIQVIWPQISPPGWVIDGAVVLYVLTLLGARVVAAETFKTISPGALSLPIWKRRFALVALGGLFYLASLALTVTLIGPVASIYAIVKGGAIFLDFPKSWTRVHDGDEASRAQLRALFVGTFGSAATAVLLALAFFAANAYGPGIV